MDDSACWIHAHTELMHPLTFVEISQVDVHHCTFVHCTFVPWPCEDVEHPFCSDDPWLGFFLWSVFIAFFYFVYYFSAIGIEKQCRITAVDSIMPFLFMYFRVKKRFPEEEEKSWQCLAKSLLRTRQNISDIL